MLTKKLLWVLIATSLVTVIIAKKEEPAPLDEEYEDEVDEPETKEALQADASVYGPLVGGGGGYAHGHVGGYSGQGGSGGGGGFSKYGGSVSHHDHEHEGGFKGYSGYDGHGGEVGEKKHGVHEEHADIVDHGGHKKFVEDHGVHGEGVKKGGHSFAKDHDEGAHKEHAVSGEFFDKYGKDQKGVVNGGSYQDGVAASEKQGGK
ncbi:UNVERIFIED_CONTAM: hypothetical protein NCL1_38571 [Trichonephila clavipes]